MKDPRIQKLAHVLIHYSLQIKPGEKLVIRSPLPAVPLLQETYREAVRAGAHVIIRLNDDVLDEIALREANEEQLTFVSDLAKQEAEYFDVMLSFWASSNTQALSNIDPARIALRNKARQGISKRFLEREAKGEFRWCGTLFPTQAHAQDAGMSLSDYEDFVYGAGLLDHEDPAASWRAIGKQQQRIADYLQRHDTIRIIAPGTDITYRVGGHKWINASGSSNFPDGEVFSGPIEGSTNGTVRFTYPAVYNGNQVEDVQLTFREGRVVEASASRGLDFLNAMLDMDSGSRLPGEVAFGLNYNIKKFTKDILFDEKIGGTMHMALGAGYPETGNTNESGLHWDMICDLREGKVYADGELCYENGKFII